MNYRLILAVPIIALTVIPARATQDQAALAKKLIIPQIKMLDASVEETLEFTRRKSIEVDPAKKGVNLILKDLPAAAKDYKAAPVTFELTRVTVWDVIHRAATVGKLTVTATKDAITVHAKGTKP